MSISILVARQSVTVTVPFSAAASKTARFFAGRPGGPRGSSQRIRAPVSEILPS